jgi:hypothetical protein
MPACADEFTRRLQTLDLSLFETVPTQSSPGDRQSWLAVQRSVRGPSGYTYLEIGSHLGGSIQQHLVDPLCRRIISIDKRPLEQPDIYYGVYKYKGNSTARMLDNLHKVSPDDLHKIICHDCDAKDVNPTLITDPPQFCLIDGEHTEAAVLSDFEFCLQVCDPNGAICFHDDDTLYQTLAKILVALKRRGVRYTARKLGGVTFGIFLGKCPAVFDPWIQQHSHNGSSWLRRRSVGARISGFLTRITRWLTRPRAKSR